MSAACGRQQQTNVKQLVSCLRVQVAGMEIFCPYRSAMMDMQQQLCIHT
jgi:hypothetical protein